MVGKQVYQNNMKYEYKMYISKNMVVCFKLIFFPQDCSPPFSLFLTVIYTHTTFRKSLKYARFLYQ